MISKNLIIYEYQTLFDILNEISEKLDFSVLKSNEMDLSLLKSDELGNFIIIAKENNKKLHNCLVLKELPIKIEKLLEGDDSIILNNKLNDTQAKKYIESYEDLSQNNLSVETAKEHWIVYGKKENRTIKNIYPVYIDYIKNDDFVCQGKWKYMLEKIKDNFKSFILTNDSFFITRRLDDFQNLVLENKEMISIVDSNEGKHHYMDFLRYYSLSGVEKLLKFYSENFKNCQNFLDVIKKLEIESTFITEDRDCLYKMETKNKRNLHFDDSKYPLYLTKLNYPIVKIDNHSLYINSPVNKT